MLETIFIVACVIAIGIICAIFYDLYFSWRK